MGEDVILLAWSMSAVRVCVCVCMFVCVHCTCVRGVCESLIHNLVQRKIINKI